MGPFTVIYEMVDVQVAPESVDAFAEAVASVAYLFSEAPGGHELQMLQSLERPGHFRLVVGWDRVEDHLDVFRRSKAFERWKAVVGRYYQSAPHVEHFTALPSTRVVSHSLTEAPAINI